MIKNTAARTRRYYINLPGIAPSIKQTLRVSKQCLKGELNPVQKKLK